jgi:8-amino-7-oxononanoate synthase
MNFIEERLNLIKTKGKERKLITYTGDIDFFSNDYLGLSQNKEIRASLAEFLLNEEKSLGATGSRLISGNLPTHIQTENYLSKFYRSETSLLYPSGYQASLGLISTCCTRQDLILYDEKVHASARDAIKLSNSTAFSFKHNNLSDLSEKITKHAPSTLGEKFILVESLYSMDGDSPDLKTLIEITKQFDCHIILDEAHSVGIWGEKGAGFAVQENSENEIFARIVTFGKAPAQAGAAILGSQKLTDYLVNTSRAFIYSTGIPNYLAKAIELSHLQMGVMQEERGRLTELINFYLAKSSEHNLKSTQNNSPIQLIRFESIEKLEKITHNLNQEGIKVKAIFPPTVPKGEEGIRVCLHSFNTEGQIEKLIEIASQ